MLFLLKFSSNAQAKPFKIRHVRCDQGQPHCQRCTSTGRKCDGYSKDGSLTPPTSLPASAMAVRSRSTSSDDLQERRSFDFFRNEIVPTIVGFFGSPLWNLVLQASSKEPTVAQAVVALGALHERLSAPLQPTDTPIETTFPICQYAKTLRELRLHLSTTDKLDLNTILICALIHITIEDIQNNYQNVLHIWRTP